MKQLRLSIGAYSSIDLYEYYRMVQTTNRWFFQT